MEKAIAKSIFWAYNNAINDFKRRPPGFHFAGPAQKVVERK